MAAGALVRPEDDLIVRTEFSLHLFAEVASLVDPGSMGMVRVRRITCLEGIHPLAQGAPQAAAQPPLRVTQTAKRQVVPVVPLEGDPGAHVRKAISRRRSYPALPHTSGNQHYSLQGLSQTSV